ncbi:MAG: hypothetical protein VX112_05195 [Pseudomonadota bacterium]|nr:hypothetical protein [Pseudomonadota bacterium]
MKTKKNDALATQIESLSLRDKAIVTTIYHYMQLDPVDMQHLVDNMLIILRSTDQPIRQELYELYRRVKEKQWEDDERAFKKNIYMIIEALAEDT